MSGRVSPSPSQHHLLETVRSELVAPEHSEYWNKLIERHPYLHNATMVGGEALRYVANDQNGEWVALLGYSSANLHLRVRDEWLGWSSGQRERQAAPDDAKQPLSGTVRGELPESGEPAAEVRLGGTGGRFSPECTATRWCWWSASWIQRCIAEPVTRRPAGKRSGEPPVERGRAKTITKNVCPKELWGQPLHVNAVAWLKRKNLPAELVSGERVPPPRNRLLVPVRISIIGVFGQLPAARRRAGTRHRLDTVLACAVLGALAGGRRWPTWRQ